MRALLLLALAASAFAGELRQAVIKGDVAKVTELLSAGVPADDGGGDPSPLFVALRRGHVEIALLLGEHGGTMPPEQLWSLGDDKLPLSCLPAIRAVLRGGSKEHAAPAAAIVWDMGPEAAPEVLTWLGGESAPHEREAALLAFRHIAGDNKQVLAALAARDDAYETLGWNGHADAAVVRRLAQGIAEGRDDALLAAARIRWPKKPDEATAAAITEFREVLGRNREQRKLKGLDDIGLALNGKGPNPSVAGHPVGRAVRRAAVSRSSPEEKAVEAGLRWLARQQHVAEGWWGAPEPLYQVGVTALATLTFLGAGHYPYGGTEYSPNVEAALRYLVDVQSEDGVLGTRATDRFMYNHALATLALCEATHFCGHPLYENAAQRAVAFIEAARNPGLGWRYDPRGGENDTSVTSHCVHALHVARLRGFKVDEEAFTGARMWLAKLTDLTGTVGYNYPGGESYRPEDLKKKFPADETCAMTAAGTLCRLLLCDRDDKDSAKCIEMGADECLGTPPVWDDDGEIDMYYWYWGTLALHQVGGTHWRKWWEQIGKQVVPNQVREGADAGSWPPVDPWGREGGRVYATTMVVLALETPYRYARAKGVR